jgi:signal transduction histidine kinase
LLNQYIQKGGKLLGSIPLHKAKIGSQMAHELGKPITTDYLHALTVDAIQMKGITPQYVRHALCANTDEERDEWVRAITRAARSLDVKEAKTDRKKHSRENPPTVKFHRISVANLKRMDTEGPSLIKQQPMLTKLAKGESGKKPL